jgi:hypothetical protein
MAQSPEPNHQARTIRQLRRELKRAAECMSDVAQKLDHTNVGRSKFRLLRCYDRAIRAAADADQ